MPLLSTRGGASARGFGMFGAVLEAPPTIIGQSYGGGFYAGQISVAGDGIATHYLIVAPKSSGQGLFQWKTANTSTAGTGSVIAGPTNSSNMNNSSHPAAQFCESLSINGYGDWYMPAKNELEVIYYNLKPTTTLNDINSGSNLNAIPSRASNYTTGTPSQIAVTLFQSGGSEASDASVYWSSTEASSTTGWSQDFDNGQQRTDAQKLSTLAVRAVRRVSI
jgi:hypothetical protein